MWALIPLGLVALAIGAFVFRDRRPDRTVTREGTFATATEARAYYLANAARIARDGPPLAIDSALQAMAELGIADTDQYRMLAAAAAVANPTMDPYR